MRGPLAPLLRDTLVGFNYAYYAPPGAQILYTNPVFVRSHDFIGMQGQPRTWNATEVYGTGWPSNAGGRLVGSLSSLPYALAEAEQNFLVPAQTQALIWGDLVPQMILSAKIPRWWNVTPAQIHWVGLHLRYGRELLAEAAFDADARDPGAGRSRHAGRAGADATRSGGCWRRATCRDAADRVTPSELFLLARAGSRARQGRRVLPGGRDPRGWPQDDPRQANYAGHLARLRHAQTDAGQFLSSRNCSTCAPSPR